MRYCLTYANVLYHTIRRFRTQTGCVVVTVVVAVLMNVALVSCSQPKASPSLIFDESVASDFQLLAEETWAEFITVFQARSHCFGDVRLRAARTLNSRAAYDPETATVTVRVPGTPAMLQSALVHEWAHHIEFHCDEHYELRGAFLAAQGLPQDMPWRPDSTPANTPLSVWPDIPSEQYAEATVELVLGRRQIPTKVRFTQEALHAVEVWAAGD